MGSIALPHNAPAGDDTDPRLRPDAESHSSSALPWALARKILPYFVRVRPPETRAENMIQGILQGIVFYERDKDTLVLKFLSQGSNANISTRRLIELKQAFKEKWISQHQQWIALYANQELALLGDEIHTQIREYIHSPAEPLAIQAVSKARRQAHIDLFNSKLRLVDPLLQRALIDWRHKFKDAAGDCSSLATVDQKIKMDFFNPEAKAALISIRAELEETLVEQFEKALSLIETSLEDLGFYEVPILVASSSTPIDKFRQEANRVSEDPVELKLIEPQAQNPAKVTAEQQLLIDAMTLAWKRVSS